MNSQASTVELEIHGSTAILRMSRPEKRNAINPAMTQALDAALNRVEDEPSLRVAILTGAGGGFSAGTDLRESAGERTDRGGEYGMIRRERTKPLIAAVEGAALGGGMELVLASDLVVAGQSASFGLPEVRRGVVATCGGLFRTHRSLPMNIANQLLLTGDPISAQQAHDFGFVNVLTDDGAAVDGARALAERILLNSPVSLRESMLAARQVAGWNAPSGWEATEQAITATLSSADAAEGITAFFERRPPSWSTQ